MRELNQTASSRREVLKAGLSGATAWGLFSLGLSRLAFMEKAYGATPDLTTKKYDAVIQCFMSGGPSQTDTWDPKADPTPIHGAQPGDPGYVSPNNIFPTLSLGGRDIYGKPIWLTHNLAKLAALADADPTSYGLGIIRSMHHGIGAHPIAQGIMNCYWQSPVGTALYPSTPASFTYLLKDQVVPPAGLGIPSCVVAQNQGVFSNDAKGGKCPTALQVPGGDTTPDVQMLNVPVDTTAGTPDTARYQRRNKLAAAFEAGYVQAHPSDNQVSAWVSARNQAENITLGGKAAAAFEIPTGGLLQGGPTALKADLQNLTLAQELVKNGVPFVAVAIGGNDTHTNNKAGVSHIWGDTVDPVFAAMAKNLKAAGKRVLVTFIGDFGRTPNTVAPDAHGSRRDGRDHWASGFSTGLLSIGQPAFKTNAVGDTGPDGMWTESGTGATALVDPVRPGAVGGLVYRAMGYPPTDSKYRVPAADGRLLPPVDPQYQGSGNGEALWLADKFGLL